MNQEILEEVCSGLEKLMKKYKQNLSKGDKERFEATKQAHTALRKVILTCSIKGDIKAISPHKSGKKYGWLVVENDMNQKSYCA